MHEKLTILDGAPILFLNTSCQRSVELEYKISYPKYGTGSFGKRNPSRTDVTTSLASANCTEFDGGRRDRSASIADATAMRRRRNLPGILHPVLRGVIVASNGRVIVRHYHHCSLRLSL